MFEVTLSFSESDKLRLRRWIEHERVHLSNQMVGEKSTRLSDDATLVYTFLGRIEQAMDESDQRIARLEELERDGVK